MFRGRGQCPQASSGHVAPRHRSRDSESGSPRPHAARGASRPAAGRDSDGGSRSVISVGAATVDCAVLRVGCRLVRTADPVRHRCKAALSVVMPAMASPRFFLAETYESESAASPAHVSLHREHCGMRFPTVAARTSVPASDLTPAVRAALGVDAVCRAASSRSVAPKSRHSATKSTRPHASKPARRVAVRLARSRWSNGSTASRRRIALGSSRLARPTHRLPTLPRPRTRRGATRPRSRCATSDKRARAADLTRADRADCPRGEPGTPTRAYLPITARQRAQRAEWVCERGLVERRSPCAGLVDRRRARGPCRGEGMRGWLFGGWGLDVWVGRISRATWRRGVLGRASACHAYEGRAHRGRREHARHPTA